MLTFSCPAVMDVVLLIVLFAVSYGAGERGMTMAQCAWLGGIFQLTYMVASPVAGLLLSRRNARAVLIGSGVLMMAASAACLVLQAFGPLLAVLAVLGVTAALFFNGFQSFMRGEALPGGLARVTALYTFAWSSGSSVGILLSGSMYRLGAVPLALLACAIGSYVLIVLIAHRPRPHDQVSADEHVAPAHHGGTVNHDAYVWVAWTLAFAGMFAQRPVLTFFPAIGGQHGVAPAWAGLPLFLTLLLQAVVGGMMMRWTRLLHRPAVLVGVQLAAAAVFLLLWRVPGYAFSAAAISLLGAWSGYTFFSAVYYASNSGHRGRNVGVNEFLVGLGSFGGLFVCERFMRWTGHDETMYLVCAAAVLLAAAAQWFLTRRRQAAPT